MEPTSLKTTAQLAAGQMTVGGRVQDANVIAKAIVGNQPPKPNSNQLGTLAGNAAERVSVPLTTLAKRYLDKLVSKEELTKLRAAGEKFKAEAAIAAEHSPSV